MMEFNLYFQFWQLDNVILLVRGGVFDKKIKQHAILTCMISPMKSVHKESRLLEMDWISVEGVLMKSASVIIDNGLWSLT